MNKDNLFWGVVFFNGSDLYFNAGVLGWHRMLVL